MKRIDWIVLIVLVTFGALYRVVPHAWNFTPVVAIGLFSGWYYKNLGIKLVAPLLSLFLSDLWLGFYDGMIWNYLSIVLTSVGIGCLLSIKVVMGYVALGAVGASVCYFILSNFFVWLLSGMYSQNVSGLLLCYEMAIPFYQNALIGDLGFSLLIFGAYKIAYVKRWSWAHE